MVSSKAGREEIGFIETIDTYIAQPVSTSCSLLVPPAAR